MSPCQLMPSLKSAQICTSVLGFSNPSLFEEGFEGSERRALSSLCVHAHECVFRKRHCWTLIIFSLFWTKHLSYLKEAFSTGMFQLSAQREERSMDVISWFVPCNLYYQWVGTQTLQLVLWWSLHLDSPCPPWMLHYYGNLTSDYECCKLSWVQSWWGCVIEIFGGEAVCGVCV